MLKRALLIISLILSISLITLATTQDNSQTPTTNQNPTAKTNPTANPQLDKFVQLDDVAILRLLYPKESLSYKAVEEGSSEPTLEQRYQVEDVESHKVAVLSRTLGKFTQLEDQEMLAMIGVDTGTDKAAPHQSGIYALLFRIGNSGSPELIARSSNLQQKGSPFTNKIWRPALTTDVNFDKQDDLVMLQGETKGIGTYSIYSWDTKSKDFILVSNHPAETLLSFYSSLNAASQLGLEGEQAAGNNQLSSAYEKLSPKMQGQQTTDVLRRRLKEIKAVELNSLKVMIKSETSALIRIQYRLVDTDGFKQTFEGDYQIRRYNEGWQLDSERLKSVNLTK